MIAALTDRGYLTSVAYADDADLAARQDLYRYADPPIDLIPWALGLIDWRGDERVLDVGCGNGRYLVELADRHPGVTMVGTDLSSGMVHAVRAGWRADDASPPLMQCDAQRLPVNDESIDVVLAMHVLYHVPDIDRATRELRRIVAPAGVALITTKGAGHLAALEGLVADALPARAPTARRPFAWTDPFTVENSQRVLTRWFGNVTSHVLRVDLMVSSTAPLVAYVRATRALVSESAPAGCHWDHLVDQVEARAALAISAAGAFRDQIVIGAFVCRP